MAQKIWTPFEYGRFANRLAATRSSRDGICANYSEAEYTAYLAGYDFEQGASPANVVKATGQALGVAYPWGYRSTESSP